MHDTVNIDLLKEDNSMLLVFTQNKEMRKFKLPPCYMGSYVSPYLKQYGITLHF